MKRSNVMRVVSHDNLTGLRQKVAFHEAGHATGIHFSHSQKNLLPVFFQLIFKDIADWSVSSLLSKQSGLSSSIAQIKGGRLIQSLPLPCSELNCQSLAYFDKKSFQTTDEYRLAFEADIVNLLIGPLAEAKYIALMDNEPFHHQLLTLQSMKYYGGDEDIAVVNDYLQSYSVNQEEQKEILTHFFTQAFNFVNNQANWKAITKLAHYILGSNKTVINYEEVTRVLNSK